MSAGVWKPRQRELRLIEQLVSHYTDNRGLIETMLDQLRMAVESSDALMKCVHSLRWRTKDPMHLREKLSRKLKELQQEGRDFEYTTANLFERVNDLAGFRILHLHSAQIVSIDAGLRNLFSVYRYEIVEQPTARTWDDESREFYREVGIEPVVSPNLYTSVHYVISPNLSTKLTCEIQVRTLAEELWGEVDHSMNYPRKSEVLACREQIKVLARVTSSCSRLVDSIYRTSNDHLAPLKSRSPTKVARRK